jgi:hypothetical protein
MWLLASARGTAFAVSADVRSINRLEFPVCFSLARTRQLARAGRIDLIIIQSKFLLFIWWFAQMGGATRDCRP